MISDCATRFGTVQVGYSFECKKKNGNKYAGEIVRVASYPRGTLVTIRWTEHLTNDEGYYAPETEHRSVYLEDCIEWFTEEPAPQ